MKYLAKISAHLFLGILCIVMFTALAKASTVNLNTNVVAPSSQPKTDLIPGSKPPEVNLTRVRVSNSAGNIVEHEIEESLSVTNKNSIILNGTTSPYATITIATEKNNILKKIQADQNGFWQLSIKPSELKLSRGRNVITAYATTSNGVSSSPKPLITVIVRAAHTSSISDESPSWFSYDSTTFVLLIIAGLQVLFLFALNIHSRFGHKKANL